MGVALSGRSMRRVSFPLWSPHLFPLLLLWGPSFLALRVATESIPPLLTATLRFSAAGVALGIATVALLGWRRGAAAFGSAPQAVWALMIGVLTVGLAGGAQARAQAVVPSGLAALAFATIPTLLLILNLGRERRSRPLRAARLSALLVGAGCVLAVLGGETLFGDPIGPFERALLFAAPLTWALGSRLSRAFSLPPHPLANSALQMIGGAMALGFAAGTTHDWHRATDVTGGSIAALLFLVVGSSLGGTLLFTEAARRVAPRSLQLATLLTPLAALLLGAVTGEKLGSPLGVLGTFIAVAGIGSVILPRYARPTSEKVPARDPRPADLLSRPA